MNVNKPVVIVIAALVVVAAVAAAVSAGKKNEQRRSPSPRPPVATGTPAAKTNSDDAFMADKMTVVSEDVAYFGGVKGRYARPADGGPFPGVVMIHEWWGLNDNIRTMADRLAAQGFAVLAVDLYGGKVASTAEEATALVKGVDQAKAIENMRAAVSFLRERGSAKIASLGWCFGGGQSLQLALSGPLDATVLYYGTPLVTDEAKLKAITWPVLGIFGDKDQAIPADSVRAFDKALADLKVPHDVRLYAGVGHAFANPSGPNYEPEKTRDAWYRTVQFLTTNLR